MREISLEQIKRGDIVEYEVYNIEYNEEEWEYIKKEYIETLIFTVDKFERDRHGDVMVYSSDLLDGQMWVSKSHEVLSTLYKIYRDEEKHFRNIKDIINMRKINRGC